MVAHDRGRGAGAAGAAAARCGLGGVLAWDMAVAPPSVGVFSFPWLVGGVTCFFILGVLIIDCFQFHVLSVLSYTVSNPSSWLHLGRGFSVVVAVSSLCVCSSPNSTISAALESTGRTRSRQCCRRGVPNVMNELALPRGRYVSRRRSFMCRPHGPRRVRRMGTSTKTNTKRKEKWFAASKKADAQMAVVPNPPSPSWTAPSPSRQSSTPSLPNSRP